MTDMKGLAVIGAGGHAKVVIATARALGWSELSVYDDNPACWGQRVLDIEVRGPLREIAGRGAPAILAIGANAARAKLSRELDCNWQSLIHPHALVDASCTVQAGTLVCAGVVIQPQAQLGRHVIVNTSASVDHDCRVGDFVHIAPGSRLTGEVTLAEGVFVGAGSTLIPGVRIGEWTRVGAGAVCIHDLPAGCTAMGVPARVRHDAPRDRQHAQD